MQLSLQINGSNHKTCAEGYRFGFNGKEKDNETFGDGNIYDYGFRVYDPRKAKFLSVDPLTKSYPWYTPYQFAGNKPIIAIDLDGLEEFIIITRQYTSARGLTVVYRVDFEYIKPVDRAEGAKQDGTVWRLTPNFLPALNLKKHPGTSFPKDVLEKQKDKFDLNASNDEDYQLAKIKYKQGASGGYNFPGLKLRFDNDGGKTKQEVASIINSSSPALDQIDIIAARLVYDPNSVVNVFGAATPTETNIGRSQPSMTKIANVALAAMRAQAGKDFLIEYIQQNYPNANVDPSRITTDSTKGSQLDKSTEKGVSFSVDPNEKL